MLAADDSRGGTPSSADSTIGPPIGRALDSVIRGDMESRFGVDFSSTGHDREKSF